MGKMSQKCMLRLTLRQQSYKIKSATDCAILERKNVAEAVSRRYLKNIEKSWKKEQIYGGECEKIFSHTEKVNIMKKQVYRKLLAACVSVSLGTVLLAGCGDSAGTTGTKTEVQENNTSEDVVEPVGEVTTFTLPDGPEDDGIAYLSFFVEEKEDGSLEVAGEKTTTEAVLADVKQELEDLRQFMDIGEGSVVVDETEDIDWINNWKQYFHQFYIDDILVIPSWENIKPEDTDKMVLHIDPGTAFGTGMHETTQLCIRQLRKFITPETELLDVGTGSGILAILSLMFGAKHAVGTDLDICAVEAVAQNCDVNGIDPAQFDMMIGNIITDKEVQDKVGYECYDIVVANILADVLVPLTPVIVHQLKKGGIYITSGIIDDKEQTVVEAVKAAGLEVLEVTYQGEWVSVTARKN